MSKVFFSVTVSLDGYMAPEWRSDDQWMSQWMQLQDYVFHYIAAESGRLGLPVHIHTGYGCGGYFELDNTTDLTPTFTKIALELHTQYVLGFTPPVLDGRLHRVTVRVNRPGVTIRARRNYLASSDGN